MKYKAIIFDMDGTIVDSKLDFKLIKQDIGMPLDLGILEYLDTIQDKERYEKAHQIVHKHELDGANNSEIMRDFLRFYQLLKKENIAIGLLTRNSKSVTEITLLKHNIHFDMVVTRDCAKPKPDPDGLLKICKHFQILPNQALYIGDFLYDIETAINAKMDSALILTKANIEFVSKATYSFNKYSELLSKIS